VRHARITVAAAFAAAAALGCSGPVASPMPTAPLVTEPTAEPSVSEVGPLRYVALGDSYTIGTSVTERERWPDQLVVLVPELELVANLAVNGFTSRDVIEVQLPRLAALRPDFVTLLIGVNDVVQGVPEATYRENVRRILDDVVNRVGAERLIVVTTPDYTVTPSGGDFGDPETRSAGIRANNAIISEIAQVYGVRFVDIYDISLGAATDRTLVASDGLHPSGTQYGLWVERIAPIVVALLEEEAH
jgi:acyl-CoA thioesterase I